MRVRYSVLLLLLACGIVSSGCSHSLETMRNSIAANYPIVSHTYSPSSDSTWYFARPALAALDPVPAHREAQEGAYRSYVVGGSSVGCPGRTGGPCEPKTVGLFFSSSSPEERLSHKPSLQLWLETEAGADTLELHDVEFTSVVESRFKKTPDGESYQSETVQAKIPTTIFIRAARADTLRGQLDTISLSIPAADLKGWKALSDSLEEWRPR